MRYIFIILSVSNGRMILDIVKCLFKNLKHLVTGIFEYRDLISKLAMFLFVISKDFNLFMTLPKFLMCTELIVPRRVR